MARGLHRLSARTIVGLKDPGRHCDGGGLYAAISKEGRRRWVFLFRWEGKLREMGLGGLDAVPLASARQLAAKCREEVALGRNPLEARRSREAAVRAAVEAQRNAVARAKTFGEIADELVQSRSPGWRNAKHRAQWSMTLKVYAAPLRDKAVGSITTEDVLGALLPIWQTKPETAVRTRGCIEAVIDAARARGLINQNEANPARWRGHLDHLLPKRQKLTRGHHAAMPWRDLPVFIHDLRGRSGTSARALEFCILTAARLGEVLGARWSEIDRVSGIWTCPASRMKAGREHRVPLSPGALAILEALPAGEPSALIFGGPNVKKPLSGMAMAALFKRMKREGITTHGFRSSFRDWAGEATHHQREVCEAALAHVIGNSAEQAYRRGDAIEKRRRLMTDWANYIDGPGAAKVIAFPLGTAGGDCA